MRYESPVINGDGEYSRDFTYIDNVLQMNWLAMNTENPKAVNTVYNTAYGENTTLNQLVGYSKSCWAFTTPGLLTWILFTALSGKEIFRILWPLSIKPGSCGIRSPV